MTKRLSDIKAKEICSIEEDTVVEGNIEAGAQIQLTKGASLRILGSILENVSIKELPSPKPEINISDPNLGSIYISGSVKFLPGGNISIGNKLTGKSLSISKSTLATEKTSDLIVEGNVGVNTMIQIQGNVTLRQNVANFVHIKGETITAKNIGMGSVLTAEENIACLDIGACAILKANKNILVNDIGEGSQLTADDNIECMNVGELCTLTSQYHHIIAKQISQGSKLKANKTIQAHDVGAGCRLEADDKITCGNVARKSTLISNYNAISTQTIANGCLLIANKDITTTEVGTECTLRAEGNITSYAIGEKSTLTSKYNSITTHCVGDFCILNANKEITTANIGKNCTLEADGKITCKSIGEKSSLSSKYNSIVSQDISANCNLKANKEIRAANIGLNCNVQAQDCISCYNIDKFSQLTSVYANIMVNGHVNSKVRLESSNEIHVRSYAPDAVFKTRSLITIKNENLQMPSLSTQQSSASSLPQQISGKGFNIEGDINGSVLVQRTPTIASISVQSGSQPTYIKNSFVSSSNEPCAQPMPPILEEKNSFVPKNERRNRFLAAYNKRQEASADTKGVHTTKPKI